jgi:hypothetical protein
MSFNTRKNTMFKIEYTFCTCIYSQKYILSSTSSLGIMRYCTAVDNRKDEKA